MRETDAHKTELLPCPRKTESVRLFAGDIDIAELHGAALALQGDIALGRFAFNLVHQDAVDGNRHTTAQAGNICGVPFAGLLLGTRLIVELIKKT